MYKIKLAILDIQKIYYLNIFRFFIEIYDRIVSYIESIVIKYPKKNSIRRNEMAYSAKAIANEFLDLAKEEEMPITPMKLQKLVYIAHGFNLAVFGDTLLDEKVRAWKYGPVIDSLYHEFKSFGNRNITKKATDIEVDDDFDIIVKEPAIPKEDDFTKRLIYIVWNKYKELSGVQLSALTHQKDTPWEKSYIDNIPNTVIENKVIKDHYKELLKEEL